MKLTSFPLTSKYDNNWIKQNSILHNTLYYAESLSNIIPIKANMRILDLGCGKAISSIFLAKEFNVQVWAVDREISPSENYIRIQEMNLDDKVFPLKCDARNLPFPKDFFDMIISIDSFSYYGTDDWYIPYLSQFLKQGGYLSISEWCYNQEFNNISEVPDYLIDCYQNIGFHSIHSLKWWKNHLQKTGLFNVKVAETIPENEFLIEDWIKSSEDLESEKMIVEALKKDKSKIISTFRLAGQRIDKNAYLDDFEDKQIL